MNGRPSALPDKTKIRYRKFFAVLFFTYATIFLFPLKILPKNVPYSYALYDKTGALIGASVASDGQWRFSPGEVPDKFAQAVIVFEDKRFYYHLGVDPIAVLRAVVSNIRAKVSGIFPRGYGGNPVRQGKNLVAVCRLCTVRRKCHRY